MCDGGEERTMEKKFCIFDMDGTLVDSMGYWRQLGKEYLLWKGIREEPADQVLKELKVMSIPRAAVLFEQMLGLNLTQEELVQEMQALMAVHYQNDVRLKPGVVDYLEKLKENGCRMCVATATPQKLADACLKNLGIDHYFEFLISCKMIGVGKDQPDVYLHATKQMGCRPEETAVFEDVLYAAQTAKRAGFYTVAVQDENAAHEWEELKTLADEVVTDWADAK